MARSRHSSILIHPSPDRVMSSASSVSSKEYVPKRIRFAPLPEPDREEEQSTDTPQIPRHAAEGSDPDPPPSEDLLASGSSSSSSSQSINSTPLIPGQSDSDKSSPDSSVGSSPILLLSSLPSKPSSVLDSPLSSTFSELPFAKKSHPLLRPFKRFYTTSGSGSSSNSTTPTPSISTDDPTRKSISREDILSLGVVNLFRANSRESTRSATSVNKWPSLGGSSISLPSSSSPLSRTQGSLSHKSQSTSRFPPFSGSSDSKTKPKPKPTPLGRNKHKGAVMLNGRVYGSKNNPFANIPDQEPEFVEWGYGGMGSVKGAKSAGVSSKWDRLHGDEDSRRDDGDWDDGGGMAWLRKRREERERKAREQEETSVSISESQTNTPTRSSTQETISGIPSMAPPPAVIEIPTTERPPTADKSPLAIVAEDGFRDLEAKKETTLPQNTHVLQSVNVPLRSPRRPSLRGRELSEQYAIAPQVQVAGSPILVSPSGDDDTTDGSTGVLHPSTITSIEIDKPLFPSSSSSSESESESEVGDDDDDGDDEEEEYEKGDSTLGKAALMEKVSRHSKDWSMGGMWRMGRRMGQED